jgi:hypothetical protein
LAVFGDLDGMGFLGLMRFFGFRRTLLGWLALFVIRRMMRRRERQARYAA